MRFKAVRLSCCMAFVTLGILFPIVTHASVTGLSVSETAEADAAAITTRTTFPPASISAFDSNTFDDATVTITSYVGPAGVGLTTPTLTLNGNVADSGALGGSATITYQFALVGTQPYSFSNTGADFNVTLTGPSGDVATGSGFLSPGVYTLAADASNDGNNPNFALSVTTPEPSSLGLLALVGLLGMRVRRPVL